jgi:septal ring factor EnvC (AmiA/AmiB activator)
VIVFAQELINPTVKIPFTESSGNFLVLTSFNKIGKSEITIDYVKNLRQELNDSKKLISEQQKLINEQKRSIEYLKKSINDLTRKIEDLQKKVK